MAETETIPGPAPWPFVGNLPSLDRDNTLISMEKLANEYGPIYKLYLGGAYRYFVSGPELVNELCTRKDFVKMPVGLIKAQQLVTPEGLFSADHGEEFWDIAHRVLVPAFGPLSIRGMFPGQRHGKNPTTTQGLTTFRNVRYNFPTRHEMGAPGR